MNDEYLIESVDGYEDAHVTDDHDLIDDLENIDEVVDPNPEDEDTKTLYDGCSVTLGAFMLF